MHEGNPVGFPFCHNKEEKRPWLSNTDTVEYQQQTKT